MKGGEILQWPGTKLRMAGIDYHVTIAGPGERTEIFLQGCLRDCPGCFNPETHALDGGRMMPVRYLVKDIMSNTPQRKLTVSGGEPLLQSETLVKLLKPLARNGFHILMYTGADFNELLRFIFSNVPIPKYLDIGQNPVKYRRALTKLLTLCQTIVAGPYDKTQSLPINEDNFVGSSNQVVINN